MVPLKDLIDAVTGDDLKKVSTPGKCRDIRRISVSNSLGLAALSILADDRVQAYALIDLARYYTTAVM